MKKLVIILALGLISAAASVSASCNIPDIISEGAYLRITSADVTSTLKVDSIDYKSCYLKSTKGKWINLRLIQSVQLSK